VPIARISSTSSRTSSSETALLHAKAMNDHRLSGDHDGRYILRTNFENGWNSFHGIRTVDSYNPVSDDVMGITLGKTSGESGYASISSHSDTSPLWLNISPPTTGRKNLIALYYNGTIRGAVQTDASGVYFTSNSDYRLKHSQERLSGAIDLLKNLPVYRYFWKGVEQDEKSMGMFAHEAQEVVPEAVSGQKDEVQKVGVISLNGETVERSVPVTNLTNELKERGATWTETDEKPIYQSIDYSKFVPLLVAAVQELSQQIEELKNSQTVMN